MKVLFFLSAGNGDLINFTGTLQAFKKEYPNSTIDFLIPRKQQYILEEHPAVDKILHIEDYNVPFHCKRDKNHSLEIHKLFEKDYDHIINAWVVEHFPKHNQTEHTLDFTSLGMLSLEVNNLPIKASRKECNSIFFYSLKDYDLVDKLYQANKDMIESKGLALIEDISYSWGSPNQPLTEQTIKHIKELKYAVAGNGNKYDIDVSELNLKQVKLFFTKYCIAFCGISSGMTCAIYTEPTDFSSKKMLINAKSDSWDLSRWFTNQPSSYYHQKAPYLIKNLNEALLPKFYGQWANPQVDEFIYNRYFRNKTNGFFIEAGAFDGIVAASCKMFEDFLGWKGINIEADPDHHAKLVVNRPNSTNLNAGLTNIVNSGTTGDFTSVIHPKLGANFGNGSFQHTEKHKSELEQIGCSFITKKVNMISYADLVKKYNITKVDLFVLDTEGTEPSILEGMDKSLPLPIVFCIEYPFIGIEELKGIMARLDYELDAISHNNAFFIRRNTCKL